MICLITAGKPLCLYDSSEKPAGIYLLESQNHSDHVFPFAWDIPGLCLAQLLIVPLLLSKCPSGEDKLHGHPTHMKRDTH